MKSCNCTGRLSAIALGLAFGVMTGLWMCLFAWAASHWGHGVVMVAQWGEVYQGYAATVKGGLIGAAWGFVEGFIFGVLFAWVYNLCLCCCRALCKSDEVCELPKKSNKKSVM